jgi:hypothetical protein
VSQEVNALLSKLFVFFSPPARRLQPVLPDCSPQPRTTPK